MKLVALTITLLLAHSAAQASSHDRGRRGMSCDVSSDYSPRPYRSAFLFSQEDGSPREIGIGGGRLFVDGREHKLSAADHRRLSQFEDEMRELVPQTMRVAVEAVDIAFTALGEVAGAMSSTPDKTVRSLEEARLRVRRQISAQPLGVFDEDAVGEIVGPLVAQYVPQIIGGAVSSAVKAVFSGHDDAGDFEARMQRMEGEIERKVEARAEALEPLVESMCQRLQRMDAIEDSLQFRLPDGKPLQLFSIDRRERD